MPYRKKDTLFSVKVMGLGIVRKKISKSSKAIKKSTKTIKKENLKSKKSNFNIMDYVQGEFKYDLFHYFKDIVNIIKPKRIKISGVYGFDDPSLTGMACGIIPIVSSFIPTSDINVQPVFDDEIIDIHCVIYGRISLIIAIIKTLKFIHKKDNRRKIFKKQKKIETY